MQYISKKMHIFPFYLHFAIAIRGKLLYNKTQSQGFDIDI